MRFLTKFSAPLVLAFLFVMSAPAGAGVVPIVTGAASAAFTAKAVKDILSDAQLKADQVLASARAAGDALGVRAADELAAAVANASRILADDLNETVENIAEENRKLLLAIHGMTSKISSFD